MANPITFRNVAAPDFRGSGELLQGAQNSINASGDIFTNLIKQRQAKQAENLTRDRDAAESSFRNTLNQFRSPEDLMAARQSGALEEQLAGLSPEVRDRVRGAADSRLATLRDQATAGFEYGNTVRDQKDDPFEKELKSGLLAAGEADNQDAMASGISTTVARARELNANGQLSDTGLNQVLTQASEFESRFTSDLREDARFGREEDERQRTESRRDAVSAITGDIPGIVQGTGSERAARDFVADRIQREGDTLTPADRQAIWATLSSSYGAQKGRTQEEQRDAETKGALLSRALQDARRPISELGIFDGDSATNLSQAYEYIRTNAPEDDEASVESFNSALSDFRDTVVSEGLATKSELDELPWGGIGLEALKRAGATESWLPGDDADFTEDHVLRELGNVFREYTQNRKNTLLNRELDEGEIVSRAQLGLPRPSSKGN